MQLKKHKILEEKPCTQVAIIAYKTASSGMPSIDLGQRPFQALNKGF